MASPLMQRTSLTVTNKEKCTKLQDETDVNCAAKPSANYTLTFKND